VIVPGRALLTVLACFHRYGGSRSRLSDRRQGALCDTSAAFKNGGLLMRYYFHVRDGENVFDDEGTELGSLADVRTEAALSAAEILKGPRNANFWTGQPWILWVTDQPDGGGNTLLEITLGSKASH
jgi:hypothetical protein